MTPELDSQIEPLFKELKEAILSQAYRVTSYALSDLSADAMQKIQMALEKILLQLISIEDIEIQDLALDALTYICSESSEKFLIDRLYTSDLRQNEDRLYRVGNFFLNVYRIRGVDLYAAAQRHSNTYVRLLLINNSGHSAKNISLDEIEKFLYDDLTKVRYQAVELLTDHPEKRFIPIYFQLLKDDDFYEYWDDICDALIEVGIPHEAFDILLNAYLSAIETDQEYGISHVSVAILNTLLIYNRSLTLETFLKLWKSSDQTLKWKALNAFEYIGPEELQDELFHQLNLTYSKKEPDTSEEHPIFEHQGGLLGFKDSSEEVRHEAVLGMLENQDPFLKAHLRHILSDPSHRNRISGLKYLSEHHPMRKLEYVVDSLFDQHSENLFAQKTEKNTPQDKSDFQLADEYEQYLKSVMDFLFTLKVRCHPDDKVFDQKINRIYLSIFQRLPKYFKIRMVTHMRPFLLDEVMDFIIQETRHLSTEERHYHQFTGIISTYFGDSRMNDLLIYLDTQNYRLMGLALHALCKISNQALRFARI